MENTTVKELDLQYQTFSENVSKFSEAGNKAAGTRARKAWYSFRYKTINQGIS